MKDQDFEKLTDENRAADVDFAADDDYGNFDETTARVNLPADVANGNRSIPGFCAICLCPYSLGEKVSWSPEKACQHAFHKDCIIQWLAKKDELKCPVCRQNYCGPVHVTYPASEDMFLDSFALALNYARSHASRPWAGEMSRSSWTGSLATSFEPQIRVHVMGGNNDLSLRDQSEGSSQDIEMGSTVQSLNRVETVATQLPSAEATVETNNDAESAREDATVSDTNNTSTEALSRIDP